MGIGGGVGVGVNQATTNEDLIDVNGDGLPDAVRKTDGCSGFSVRMNLGTSFARGEDCITTKGWGTGGLTALAAALDASNAANDDDDEDTDRIKGLVGGMSKLGRDATAIRQVSTLTTQAGISGSLGDDEHLGVSVNTESSLSATNIALIDVTGDGLPELLARKNDGSDFLVMVNTGYGFAEAVHWSAPAWKAKRVRMREITP